MGNFSFLLWAIFFWFRHWKNFKNRPTFAKVTVKIKVAQFFWLTVYVCVCVCVRSLKASLCCLCGSMVWWLDVSMTHSLVFILWSGSEDTDSLYVCHCKGLVSLPVGRPCGSLSHFSWNVCLLFNVKVFYMQPFNTLFPAAVVLLLLANYSVNNAIGFSLLEITTVIYEIKTSIIVYVIELTVESSNLQIRPPEMNYHFTWR